MPSGGKRPGAGRPPGKTRRRITFRLSIWLVDWLKRQEGSQSVIIEKALVAYYKLKPPAETKQ